MVCSYVGHDIIICDSMSFICRSMGRNGYVHYRIGHFHITRRKHRSAEKNVEPTERKKRCGILYVCGSPHATVQVSKTYFVFLNKRQAI